jgi:hypothetical protein
VALEVRDDGTVASANVLSLVSDPMRACIEATARASTSSGPPGRHVTTLRFGSDP